MKTKYGEITPETLYAAYEETGLKPTIGYGDKKTCGCGLVAFTLANNPEAELFDVGRLPWIVIRQQLGINETQEAAFGVGFSGSVAPYETSNPDKTQALALGYACRNYIIGKGIEILGYEQSPEFGEDEK